MIKNQILLILAALTAICIVDIQTLYFVLITYCVGLMITCFVCVDKNSESKHLYTNLFSIGSIYMFICFAYMQYHDYEYMFAFDTINYFLPEIHRFLDFGDVETAFAEIWANFSLFSYYTPGYFTYSVIFAHAGRTLGADMYLVQQISTLLLYCFSGLVLYKIFGRCGFDTQKSYRHTVTIMLCSIVFFYSSQILRDIHILLLYLGVIYYMLDDEFRINSIVKILLLTLICCTFRLESGLFLIAQIPVYLWINLEKSKNKSRVILISFAILTAFLAWVIPRMSSMVEVFERNQDYYVEDIAKESGIIGMLQRIPLIGDFLSILYNMLQPIPFWSRFSPPSAASYGIEVYNIMRFPVAIASSFSLFAVTITTGSFLSKNIRNRILNKISKPLKYQLLIGFLFLYLQAAVISQRRLMAYYFMFYLLFFLIWDSLNGNDRKNMTGYFILLFVGLQLAGFLLLQ